MRKIKNIVFWVAISIFVGIIFIQINLWRFDLELANSDYELSFYRFVLYALPICLFIALNSRPNLKPGLKSIIINILKSFVFTIAFTFYFLIFMFAFLICDWTNKDPIFIHKKNNDAKIIQREYGCGAYDGDEPDVKYFEINEFSEYIIYAKEIDIEKIDQNKWEKIN